MESSPYENEEQRTPPAAWLTRIAFGGALVLVIARGLMLQYLHADLPMPLPPGEPMPARSPGPGVGVILDSFSLLMAVLVLARAALDRNWRLARTWSVLPLALLSIWAFASMLWASDKFAAAASASTWLAAAALVFVFAQTVRTWSSLRIVAGVAAGLFLANVAFGVIYRVVDLPPLIEDFQKNKLSYFAERGWEPDSFAAKNFEHRVMAGATGGFAASPNSFAATLVMLGFVMAGLIWQRLRDRSEPIWAGVLVICFAPAAWILWTTQSRTALAAALLGAVALAVGWRGRHLLARNRRVTFAGLVMLIALAAVSVIGIGLATGTLPHDSLAFRWNYWRGAWGVFLDSPLRGVGFANFGDAYLAHRVPIAAEEVKDPHNFFVRFFSETGLVGGLLTIAWLVGFIWSQTRGTQEPEGAQADGVGQVTMRSLAWLVVAGVIVHSLFAVDFSADPVYVGLELVRRGLYGLLMLGALLLGTIRSAREPVVETTPAPALLAAAVAGLAAVLVHAMVDVVVFEPSVLASFAMLMGAVIGIRVPAAYEGAAHRGLWPATGAAALGVMSFLALFALPLSLAEREAADGDDLVRKNRPAPALLSYQSAQETSPVANAHYHHRAARAMAYAGRSPGEAEAALKRAIAANPRGIAERVSLAGLYMGGFDPPRLQEAQVIYRDILRLNPNDLQLRLQYAHVLERLGRAAEAADELDRVLGFNEQLSTEEPERLQAEQEQEIRSRIMRLRGS